MNWPFNRVMLVLSLFLGACVPPTDSLKLTEIPLATASSSVPTRQLATPSLGDVALPSAIPENTQTPVLLSIPATATSLPDTDSTSWVSPDGNWTIHEDFYGLNAQVVSKDGATKWVISEKDIEPMYGMDFNTWAFYEDAVFFGIGPRNYEIQILQREPPFFSLYRLDLVKGSIKSILKSQKGSDGFPLYTYFDVSSDQARLVYSRWYESTIIVRELSTQAENAIAIPSGYLIAGGFLWSPDQTTIVSTIWQDAYETPTTFAVVLINVHAQAVSFLMKGKESDYFLTAKKWIDERTILLQVRRTGQFWQIDATTGRLQHASLKP